VRLTPDSTAASSYGRRPSPPLRAIPLLTALLCLVVFAVESVCRGQELTAAPPAIAPLGQQPALSTLPAEPLAPTLFPPPGAGPALAPAVDDHIVLEMLPFGVLWEPPIANQREPRCYAIFNSMGLIDTAIGADFSLGRIGPASHKDEGFEADVFAAAFTRFDERRAFACADYRVGCPLTFAANDWQYKLSYEHTSSHLGDDAVMDLESQWAQGIPAAPARKFCRDEIVLGIARRFWDQLRVYGQVGCSFSNNADANGFKIVNDVWRYDWGVEWTPPRHSQQQSGPYAAFDMDLRDEQNYVPNVTIEAGWQWRVRRGRDSAARLGVEYYNGDSPFGAYILEHETWWGFIASYDW
jgi:hypothetical protein